MASSRTRRFDAGGRACQICGHSPLRHYNWLNRYVLNVIKQHGYSGPGRDAMVTLRKEVLDGMLLRRTKLGRAADLSLPSRLITIRKDLELDAFESDFYTALWTQTSSRFDAYVQSGTVLNNYAHVFDLLTRLRQAVDHPYLILHGHGASAGEEGVEVGDLPPADWHDVCGICREVAEDGVLTGCRHVFCRLCMQEFLESLGGRAIGFLRDVTAEAPADGEGRPAAAVGAAAGAGAGGEGAAKTPAKKASGGAAAAATPSGGAGGGTTPTCPTCFAPLTVNLVKAIAAGDGAGGGGGASSSPASSPTTGAPSSRAAAAAAAPASTTRHRGGILSRIPPDRLGRDFRSSTKIEALLEDLWRAQREDPGLKAIVFR